LTGRVAAQPVITMTAASTPQTFVGDTEEFDGFFIL